MREPALFASIVAAFSIALSLTGCAQLNYVMNKGYMDEIAKKPHTAHIMDYTLTFPRAAELQDEFPGGLESSGPEISDYAPTASNNEGEVVYFSEWSMAQGGGEIDFYVIDNIRDGQKPADFKTPHGFSNMQFKDAGTVDACGLKFKKVIWTGDFKDPATDSKAVPGVSYEARDADGKLIGLRGIYLGSAQGAERLTEKVLKSLKKVPVQLRAGKDPYGKTVSQPYGVIAP